MKTKTLKKPIEDSVLVEMVLQEVVVEEEEVILEVEQVKRDTIMLVAAQEDHLIYLDMLDVDR